MEYEISHRGIVINAHCCHHKLYKFCSEIRSGQSTTLKHDRAFRLPLSGKNIIIVMFFLPCVFIKLSTMSLLHIWRLMSTNTECVYLLLNVWQQATWFHEKKTPNSD
jgi:hypothetical protein